MTTIQHTHQIVTPYLVKHVKFAKREDDDFLSVLKKRISQEFQKKGISTYANTEMMLKTLMILVLYAIFLGSIYSNYFHAAGVIAAYCCLGFVSTLNGLNIAHDSNHSSYFQSQRLNRILARFFDLNGTSSYIWRISHNTQHHIFTNIPGQDYDIDKAVFLRLQPTDALYPFHYFQNWYAPILYCISTLNWVCLSDYVWFVKEWKKGTIPLSEGVLFFFFKIANLVLVLFLPMILTSVSWWVVLLGWLCLHFVAGFTSAIVFQLGHIVEGVEYVLPDKDGALPYDWALHEMITTSNFSTKSRLVTFFVGGLNFQVEHHLFPHICHVHYFWMSKIVKKTAKEFNMPYNDIPTFFGAICSHFRALKKLGREKNWNYAKRPPYSHSGR